MVASGGDPAGRIRAVRDGGRCPRTASGVGAVLLLGVTLAVLLAALPALGDAPPASRSDDLSRPDGGAARVEPDPGAASVTGAPDQHGPTWLPDDIVDQLEGRLAELADGLARADAEAVAAVLRDADGEVAQRWRTRAANLADVPFDELRLRLDPRPGVMTSRHVRARFDDVDEVVVVGAVEEHVLAGQDHDGPARHRHTLTFVREHGEWLLADDRDGRALGRPEPGFLWDLAPVVSTRQGPVLALYTEEATGVGPLVAETVAAMRVLPSRWPGEWSQRTTLVVPADREQLSHVLGGTLELDDFLAFTSATTHSAPGVHELTGTRLVINPGPFPDAPESRERVLLHELVHVATRPVASARLPMWLEEGIAQALGEQGPSTGHTRGLAAAGPAGRRLPTDAEFSAAGRQATHLAYQRAYSFLDHLVERSGREAVVDFYTAVGASATQPGTLRHRLDAAAGRELGADLDTLVAEWRADG